MVKVRLKQKNIKVKIIDTGKKSMFVIMSFTFTSNFSSKDTN